MKISKERKLLVLADFITVNLSTFFLFFLKFKSGIFQSTLEHSYTELFLIMPIIYLFWLVMFHMRDMYRSFYFRSAIEIFLHCVSSLTIGVVIVYLITIELNNPETYFRFPLIIYYLVMVAFVAIGRLSFKLILNRYLRKGIGLRNALIIGYNKSARKIVREYLKGSLLGLKIIGFIDDDPDNPEYQGIKTIGNFDNFDKLITKRKIREIIISIESKDPLLINKIILKSKDRNVFYKVVPSLNDIISGNVRTFELFNFTLLELFPDILSPFQRFIKRSIDLMASFILLMISFPIIIISAIIIKIDSPGNIIYHQKRVGKDFEEFTVFKFRSMRQDAESKTGAVWATKDDPRVTKFGDFMRKTRIDELPQLLNVLIGNMSFVGPRPERKVFVDEFIKNIPFYYKRLHIKPGLTGWAQVKHKYDETVEDVKEKLKYDLFYIENLSLKLDLIIILHTVRTVVNFRGH
ncbi:MAG: exopolysaccharide biosynthesis polyprenyl glycosylphosphotransferase [Candidatus Delongbacteria bacterium]|nr:exopolysaccharide biosynthesis polyprenyl glycosylphosphotransferase [Candidatus Delongbacteria bacterium]